MRHVAVITERACVPGREKIVLELLKKLQAQAQRAPGFQSTIAYRDLEQPQRLVVISCVTVQAHQAIACESKNYILNSLAALYVACRRWEDPAAWNLWAKQLERSVLLEEMRGHLFGPITHRILREEGEETFLL